MEGDRKYRQRGYNDSDRPSSDNGSFKREDRPRPQGPRPPLDITGPRLPRMVQSVTASRCYNCSTMLGEGFDFKAMSQVRSGAALLQAVLLLRAVHALSVPEADHGAHRGQGPGQ